MNCTFANEIMEKYVEDELSPKGSSQSTMK